MEVPRISAPIREGRLTPSVILTTVNITTAVCSNATDVLVCGGRELQKHGMFTVLLSLLFMLFLQYYWRGLIMSRLSTVSSASAAVP